MLIGAISERKKLNRIIAAQECDATEVNQGIDAEYKKNFLTIKQKFPFRG